MPRTHRIKVDLKPIRQLLDHVEKCPVCAEAARALVEEGVKIDLAGFRRIREACTA